MKPKLSIEEINVIQHNLVAIGVVTIIYDLSHGCTKFKINSFGMNLYATLLRILNQTKILNGPLLSHDYINMHSLSSSEHLLITQKFIEFTPLEINKCSLTKRGMEHIIIMFDLSKNKDVGIVSRINRFINTCKV